MKVLVSILILLTSQMSMAHSSGKYHSLAEEIEVQGQTVEELDRLAGHVGAHRCSSMFYGFGELRSLELISIESAPTCDSYDPNDCEEPLIGKYLALCVIDVPSFE